MTTHPDLPKARRWAVLHANERQAPTYIYQTPAPDAQIVISLVPRATTLDGVALELLETEQP